MEDARQGGADESQLEILRRGEVVFADYEAALGRTFACMRSHGIEVVEHGLSDLRGFPQIRYSWAVSAPGLSGEQVMALGDECEQKFSSWVDSAWQTQPSSMELAEKNFVPYRPAVVACLRENGATVADDVTRSDAIDVAMKVIDKEGIGTGVDCFAQAGIQM